MTLLDCRNVQSFQQHKNKTTIRQCSRLLVYYYYYGTTDFHVISFYLFYRFISFHFIRLLQTACDFIAEIRQIVLRTHHLLPLALSLNMV